MKILILNICWMIYKIYYDQLIMIEKGSEKKKKQSHYLVIILI